MTRSVFCVLLLVLPIAANAEPLLTICEQEGYLQTCALIDNEYAEAGVRETDAAIQWLPGSGSYSATIDSAVSVPIEGSLLFLTSHALSHVDYSVSENSFRYDCGGLAISHRSGDEEAIVESWSEPGDIRIRFYVNEPASFTFTAHADGDTPVWQAGFNLGLGWPSGNPSPIVYGAFDRYSGSGSVEQTGVLTPGPYTFVAHANTCAYLNDPSDGASAISSVTLSSQLKLEPMDGVPEPTSLILLMMGSLGLVAVTSKGKGIRLLNTKNV